MQYSPSGQSRHVCSPDVGMYLPAPHLSHFSSPVDGCTVPGLHGVCSVAPVLQKEPAGHVVHCPLLARPWLALYEPSKHGSAADAPSRQ